MIILDNGSIHKSKKVQALMLVLLCCRYLLMRSAYLEVVLEQNIALQTEVIDIDVRARRQIASVQLIKALGGGWAFCEAQQM